MTNTAITKRGRPRTGITRKIGSCACAATLALSLGVMVPLDQVLPEQFNGGAAYAAQSSLTAGKIAGADSKGANGASVSKSAKGASLKTAEATLLRAGTYRLTNVASGLALDVPSGSRSEGLQMQLWSVNSLLPQNFVFTQVSTNVFTIQAACSGKCLTDKGGRVTQQYKTSALTQRWKVVKEGKGYGLMNMGTRRMLTTTSTARYAKLVTRVRNNGTYEQWRFTTRSIIPNGCYLLETSLGSGQMLDVNSASTASGANVQIYRDNGTNAQKWQITHVGNGYYKLINAASGKALDVNYRSLNVRQYTYGSNYATELWRAEVSNNGGIVFTNKYNGKALSVNGSNRSGTNVVTGKKNSSSAQRWNLWNTTKISSGSRSVYAGMWLTERTDYNGVKTISIPNGTYTVRNVMGRMLDVSAGSAAAGANVQIWDNNGSNAQKWTITSVGNGYYTLKCVCSGMALDVMNGWTGNGTNVRQWYVNNSGAQRWKAEYYNGSLVFVNEVSGKVLDVSANVNANGRNVQIWDRNNCTAQRWTISKTSVSINGMSAEEYAVARDVFNSYNDFRARKGLPRLPWSDYMSGIATSCSKNCARLGRLQHGTAIPNYGTRQQNMSDILAYSSWRMTGSEAVRYWEDSTGHRRMMQCNTATAAGVGVYKYNGLWYYTIVYDFRGTNQNGW